jgi:Protein of unknown function (DUF5661)
MKKKKQISSDEAKRIGESLHLDLDQVGLEQFRQGLMGKDKRGALDPETGSAYDGVLLAGKVVLAHMEEFPDYFSRLEKLRAEADKYQSKRK